MEQYQGNSYYCTTMFLSLGNCLMLIMLWVGALLWWSSHNLSCHNSCLFSHTQRSIYCMRCSDWSPFSSFSTVFGADFLCPQISSNTVLFHVQLTCDRSNSQPTITTLILAQPTLTSDLLIESLPLLESFFIPSGSSLNFLC